MVAGEVIRYLSGCGQGASCRAGRQEAMKMMSVSMMGFMVVQKYV